MLHLFILPSFSKPSPWKLLIFLLSLRLCIFQNTYIWNHTVCNLSDWFLSLGNVYVKFFHVFLRPDSAFLLSMRDVPLHDYTQFVYLFAHWTTFGCVQVLAVGFCVDIGFQFIQGNSKDMIVEPHFNTMLSFLRNCQTIFQRGCTTLHSYQQQFLLLHILTDTWYYQCFTF